MKTKHFLLTAGVSLALALTFSCSSDDSPPPDVVSSSSAESSSSVSSSSISSSSVSSSSSDPCASLNPSTHFCDARDNKQYKYKKIGTQTWMAENLNYAGDDNSIGRCYGDNSGGDNEGNCEIYGRLYDWNTAMGNAQSSTAVPSGVQGVCPVGWHLPSDAEWTVLTNFVEQDGGCSDDCAGTKLKAESGWNNDQHGTDNYGFSALPGGIGNLLNGIFRYIGDGGSWWSATEHNANYAYGRDMGSGNGVTEYSDYKSNMFSVRCVKD